MTYDIKPTPEDDRCPHCHHPGQLPCGEKCPVMDVYCNLPVGHKGNHRACIELIDARNDDGTHRDYVEWDNEDEGGN